MKKSLTHITELGFSHALGPNDWLRTDCEGALPSASQDTESNRPSILNIVIANIMLLLISCGTKPVQCPPCPKCATLPMVKLMTLKDTTEMVLYTGHDFVYQPEISGGNVPGKRVRVKIILMDGTNGTVHKEER